MGEVGGVGQIARVAQGLLFRHNPDDVGEKVALVGG